IGRRRPDRHDVEVLAGAGPEASYADALKLSADPADPGGGGPVGIVLREGHVLTMTIDAPAFAPWREVATRHGFGAIIVAVASTRDTGQLALTAYARAGSPPFGAEMLDWAQRLADELARFWDHQQLLERSLRLGRYRTAQRAIQHSLLAQPDPAAVYAALAHALVDIAGALAVDVFVAAEGEPMLQRVALVGSITGVMQQLPAPPCHADPAEALVPTLAFMRASPVIRRHPDRVGHGGRAFNPLLRDYAGAVGCWPVFGRQRGATDKPGPSGVFVVVASEGDAFDDDLCRLLDELADATGLALHQHAQRDALRQEKDRQTYLALHDDLTGLPNRRALERHLEQVLRRADERGRQVAVGLLDLDDLKPINDRHGHAAGDHLLVEMARRFRRGLRANDYLARLGGDEFVLVFEDLETGQEVDGLLERVDEALRQPLTLDDAAVSVGASLGVALYASGSGLSGEQLMRRADQAMYRIKARKRQRSRWWALVAADGVVDKSGELTLILPYGEAAAEALAECHTEWMARLPAIVDGFCEQLRGHDGIAALLALLPAADLAPMHARLVNHLQGLLLPELTDATQRKHAYRAGVLYAACGLEEVWLLEVIEELRNTLATALGSMGRAGRRALAVLLQRLGMERQWQLESMRELQRKRVAVLAQLNALAWSAESYLALIQGTADILTAHPEVLACSVGRPDGDGQLTYEAAAGHAFTRYLRALVAGQAAPIGVREARPEGQGPSGRAWRSGAIQRCGHYGSDPTMALWSKAVLELGVVSSVSVPLCPTRHQPAAVLAVFSPYLGGFRSEDQQAFIEQIRIVLELALVRLAPPRPGTELLPFIVRERWRASIATGALEMHYQPMVRLADGRATEIEALARLHDIDGELLTPARFLPALDSDDLLALFCQGLSQAVACQRRLAEQGALLDVSVNVPATALHDARYVDMVASAIRDGRCDPATLLLEILESSAEGEHVDRPVAAGVQSLRALGVRLVEDDLGAGYSSLIRLRKWPFDRIKIDQAIVGQARTDPRGTLRFVRQLIRIGYDMRLEVVVEGLETPALAEAARILGADFGQGYALAQPMPLAQLAEWMARRPTPVPDAAPRTGLGALAAELRWEERFLALPDEPAYWKRHPEASCGPGMYLHGLAGGGSLHAAHEAMHRAAEHGPADEIYREAHEAFLALLVQHVLAQP
ncbi:MAG TPA: EAL domain-containing protein, partial [Rhodanobacter sp.]|nr:EAL domain-containing protein [Rhodanobacter sp.]